MCCSEGVERMVKRKGYVSSIQKKVEFFSFPLFFAFVYAAVLLFSHVYVHST